MTFLSPEIWENSQSRSLDWMLSQVTSVTMKHEMPFAIARTCNEEFIKKHVFLKHSCLEFGREGTLQHGSLFFLTHIWKFRLNCSTQLSLCYQKHSWKSKEVLENKLRYCRSRWKREEGGNYYLQLTVKFHWNNW